MELCSLNSQATGYRFSPAVNIGSRQYVLPLLTLDEISMSMHRSSRRPDKKGRGVRKQGQAPHLPPPAGGTPPHLRGVVLKCSKCPATWGKEGDVPMGVWVSRNTFCFLSRNHWSCGNVTMKPEPTHTYKSSNELTTMYNKGELKQRSE